MIGKWIFWLGVLGYAIWLYYDAKRLRRRYPTPTRECSPLKYSVQGRPAWCVLCLCTQYDGERCVRCDARSFVVVKKENKMKTIQFIIVALLFAVAVGHHLTDHPTKVPDGYHKGPDGGEDPPVPPSHVNGFSSPDADDDDGPLGVYVATTGPWLGDDGRFTRSYTAVTTTGMAELGPKPVKPIGVEGQGFLFADNPGAVVFNQGHVDHLKWEWVLMNRNTLRRGSWYPLDEDALGATDSKTECQDYVDEECEGAGFGGGGGDADVGPADAHGCVTCLGKCSGGCNENGCPHAGVTECPDPK